MTNCPRCGIPTQSGRLCRECSLEERYGLPDDDVGVDEDKGETDD